MGTTAYFKIEEDGIWASGYTPLHLADLFSTPPSTPSSGALLYASSGELVGMDDAGNTTTLTPHNFSLIPDGPSEPLAWSYYSERDGKAINVDMLKLARLVEELTDEQLVYIVNKMK